MINEKSGSDKLSGKTKFGDVILDTGASHHMTGQLSLLTNVVSISPCSIGFVDGSTTFALSMGSFPLSSKISLTNVLYVPALNCTLISVSKILKQTGCLATFTDTVCVLQDRFSRTLIGTGEERDGVYFLTDVATAKIHLAGAACDQTLWQQCLGHPSFSVCLHYHCFPLLLLALVRVMCVFELNSFNKANDCFSLIHVDVWGPYRVPSSCGAVYFLTIVDDFSRAVWTFLMLAKSEVNTILTNFITYISKQFDKSVKIVRSDNGTEFTCLASKFQEQGIVHQTSCVGTPQQNGRVERKHRHILNIARALLFQAKVPIKFWGEVVLTAAYLINQTPTTLHKGRSPYEVIHGRKPDYNLLRVFGSACYVHRAARDKDKFGEHSRLCVFLGYPFGKKGYRVFDMEREEILVSRDVIFREDVFPFETQASQPQSSVEGGDTDWCFNESILVGRGSVSPTLIEDTPAEASTSNVPELDSANTTAATKTTELATTESVPPAVDIAEPVATETTEVANDVLFNNENNGNTAQQSEEASGRGHRQRVSSVRLQDYVTYNAVVSDTPHALPLSTSSSSSLVQGNSLYPLTNYICDANFTPQHRAFLTSVTAHKEPKHFKEAVGIKVWDDSMTVEIVALEGQHTWDIIDLPPGKVAIGSQWVYKIKFNADGTIRRYKSRLVGCGNKQVCRS